MSRTRKPAKPAKITQSFVNSMCGYAEIHVKGGITQLERRAHALFALLKTMCPEKAFTVPPKSQWRHYIDCNGRCTDAYEIRLEVWNSEAVSKALFDYQYGR